ncbi:hypothetical protein OG252_13395 [Streptomyces sp. NBC_01352]|uniref:hypothetical protein n=1 Tax=Streptomyces sp. NBC_01352 TaxID=2903834 RepID=UPI002E2F3D9F|nr:hypothetical protein [Streptomyces sp. NBC_01352]
MAATSPAEWAAAGSLGVTSVSLIAFALSFADADLGYFNPRHPLARLVESGRLDWLLITVGPARVAIRDAVLDLAALLILLTTSPKGAMA